MAHMFINEDNMKQIDILKRIILFSDLVDTFCSVTHLIPFNLRDETHPLEPLYIYLSTT